MMIHGQHATASPMKHWNGSNPGGKHTRPELAGVPFQVLPQDEELKGKPGKPGNLQCTWSHTADIFP